MGIMLPFLNSFSKVYFSVEILAVYSHLILGFSNYMGDHPRVKSYFISVSFPHL